MSNDSQNAALNSIGAWKVALYGALGAVAPDILILYSKRWTMAQVTFEPSLYLFASLLYILLGAFVAVIFPYRIFPQETAGLKWKAFCVGISLPILISGLATFGRDQLVVPRGDVIPGTFWDLISLF